MNPYLGPSVCKKVFKICMQMSEQTTIVKELTYGGGKVLTYGGGKVLTYGGRKVLTYGGEKMLAYDGGKVLLYGGGKVITFLISPQKLTSPCTVKSTKMTCGLKEDLDLPQFMH